MSELWNLYLHAWFYPAADAIEVHYVLGTDSRIILCNVV